MGAGKTAVGGAVARRLGWPLVDVDAAIVERTGCTTRQLWERGGEAAYRPLERAITIEALEREGPEVIGVPAGVAMDPDGQRLLRRRAQVVWLRATVDTLVERVGAQDHRPLIDAADPRAILERQAAARTASYDALADLVIDVDGRTPRALAADIIGAMR